MSTVADRPNPGATRQICDYVAGVRPADIPDAVRREARRAFLNILGCMIGGSRHETVTLTKEALRECWGPPQATLIAQGEKADMLSAALINCLSGAADSFDDSHSEAMIHPSGPVAGALLALSERRPVTGAEFLHAFALGLEVMCRVAKATAVPPARSGLAWVLTPVVGGIAAAAAAGKLLGLDGRKLAWAIGLAGSQASGYRGNHGTMNMALMPAHAARSGLAAALMADRGVTSSQATLEARYGFCEVFSERSNPAAVTDRLGDSFEMLGTTYKPFPCGIVATPVVEACLRLKDRCAAGADDVARIEIAANPKAVALADRPHPRDPSAAQLSLQHWAAVVLAHAAATTRERSQESINEPAVARLRDRVTLSSSPRFAEDAARVTLFLRDGMSVSERIEHCIGSAERPMSDEELQDKFRALAEGPKTSKEVAALIDLCWCVDQLDDVAKIPRAAA